MISYIEAAEACSQLEALEFFPCNSPGAKDAIVSLLVRMVATPEQLDWLVRTMIDRVGKWRGTAELRGVFCLRFPPLDLVPGEVSPDSPLFQTDEQCETREKLRAAEPTSVALLESGEPADPEFSRKLLTSAVSTLPDFPAPGKPNGPLTQRDIERAREDMLLKKAVSERAQV